MARLTLTPGREVADDAFAEGSYAYAFADRRVRIGGKLVTATPLFTTATDEGTLGFDLEPSIDDTGEEFAYTVSVFDPKGRRLWVHNVVMPDRDVSVYDLVPKPIDYDSPEARP